MTTPKANSKCSSPCYLGDVAYWNHQPDTGLWQAKGTPSPYSEASPSCSRCRILFQALHCKLEHRELTLYEKTGWLVMGVDEAGRGAWAGPVVAGAVVLDLERLAQCPLSQRQTLLRDSKKLTPEKRQLAFKLIQNLSLAYGVGFQEAAAVDHFGIVAATHKAMEAAYRQVHSGLPSPVDLVVVDGATSLKELKTPQLAVLRAESAFYCVAAASIVAKVSRDQHMSQLGQNPTLKAYGFESHKGYGTHKHQCALKAHGISSQHRQSYKPVARYS